MLIKINLEDVGQDLLYFITDSVGKVVECGPFHNDRYVGAFIPLNNQKLNRALMIHHPPQIEFGHLKYKVKSIEKDYKASLNS